LGKLVAQRSWKLGTSIFFFPLRHDPQGIIGQGPLQRERVRGIGRKPLVDLDGRRQKNRPAFG
jgi:hypothetical protein